MKIKILSKSGESKKDQALPKEVLSADNHSVITEYINFVRSAKRQSIADTKDRSEVSGGGKKPWKQKGTGRARHGSSRSPIWIGGGVTFGPTRDRNFWQSHSKKFKRYAKNAIINYLAHEGKVSILPENIEKIDKTKVADEMFQSYEISGKITLVLSDKEFAHSIAFRNLPYLTLVTKTHQNITDMVSSDSVVFTQEGYTDYFDIISDKKAKSETDN